MRQPDERPAAPTVCKTCWGKGFIRNGLLEYEAGQFCACMHCGGSGQVVAKPGSIS